MSRIGERKISIPDGVTVSVNGNVVDVKGPKGELNYEFSKLINVLVEDGVVLTKQIKPSQEANMMQGTTNSLISNMITGVSKGYDKGLEAVGVGYRFQVSGNKITIHGIDKQKVSEFAANVRKVREPEPYKGKGIRYKGEHVRRKEGKKAA